MNASTAEEQFRRSLLDVARRLGGRAADGWVAGSKLAIAARDNAGEALASEEIATLLIEDLIGLELLAEKDREPTGGIGVRQLRHRLFKITDRGWRLRMGEIAPVPGVAGRDE